MTRHEDGSAGDVDYGKIGDGYSDFRRPDPLIAKQISEALGDATSILNVGAGTGSYEPDDRMVTALDPSESMRAQRPFGLPPAINGVAEHLPFEDASFDASMAIVTVHQWSDLEKGLRWAVRLRFYQYRSRLIAAMASTKRITADRKYF